MIEEKGEVPNWKAHRSEWKHLAMAHGAESDIGIACHNLLGMTQNWLKYPERRPQLTLNIQRERSRLDELKRRLAS